MILFLSIQHIRSHSFLILFSQFVANAQVLKFVGLRRSFIVLWEENYYSLCYRCEDMSDTETDSVQFFEGVEKLLEIWFVKNEDPQSDLRVIPR